jgi:hypothetical protein
MGRNQAANMVPSLALIAAQETFKYGVIGFFSFRLSPQAHRARH